MTIQRASFFSRLRHRAPGAAGETPSLQALRDEVALLSTYSTDTIYRLRYGTMQYDYISAGVERLLGFTPEEMRRLPFRDLILETRIVSDGMRPVESFVPLEESRRRGEVSKWQADYLMQTKDGRQIWVADVSYPWFGPDGAIIGSIGSLRDITERVEAEARVRQEIERMSSIDALTGLYSRPMFFIRLEEEIKRLKRSFEDMAVLIIDIDRFKKVNADFGYPIGDRVIAEVGKLIAACLRTTDAGARLSGGEFGAILPDTPASGAYWVAERIRSAVANHIFQFNDEHLMGCTVSIGVGGARFDQNMDAASLHATADRRLFIAKKTGRNRVSMDEVMEVEE